MYIKQCIPKLHGTESVFLHHIVAAVRHIKRPLPPFGRGGARIQRRGWAGGGLGARHPVQAGQRRQGVVAVGGAGQKMFRKTWLHVVDWWENFTIGCHEGFDILKKIFFLFF